MSIFNNLPEGRWAKIDLDKESRKGKVRFDDPRNFQNWLDYLHRERNVAYSYGGFLEDRSHLAGDHYQKETGAFTHLGTDYWVPAGTQVTLFEKGIVRYVMQDPDKEGGWGGRITWELDSGLYLIYGHLGQDIPLRPGQACRTGEVVGVIGKDSENGNWSPHLHAQLMRKDFVDRYASDLGAIDGYLPKDSPLIRQLVDPEEFIRL